jgi:hypothetical protein
MDQAEPAVVARLAAGFRRELAKDQVAGEVALAASQLAAQEIAGSWPQLGEIIACCQAVPGEACPFCDPAGFIHSSEPQDVPAWAVEAREVKAAAAAVLEAVALAMAPGSGTMALAAEEPFGPADRQSLGSWLAGLYRTSRDDFYKTFQVLRNDPSPASQEAIAEAHRLVFGDQPGPPPGHVPAIPRLSHASVRNSLELEGHRNRVPGDGSVPPPPPEPETRPEPRHRRRRRR